MQNHNLDEYTIFNGYHTKMRLWKRMRQSRLLRRRQEIIPVSPQLIAGAAGAKESEG